jgi:uncharacterized iron-regulated membrane protein
VRNVLMLVHRWVAIVLGIYLVVISVSGSAVIFRPEINRWAIPRFVPDASGQRVSGDDLRAALEQAYPGSEVVSFGEPRFRRQPVNVLLVRDGKEDERLFDPYALADMGQSYPPVVRAIEWLVSLHDDLLASETGRMVNGIGGALGLVIVISGMVVWWPGRRSWRRSLYVPGRSARTLWHLHSAIGFWLCLLLLNWTITSLYLAFPGPFEDLRDWLDNDVQDITRPGDKLIPFLLDAHFGRFGGWWGRTTWAILGLAPAALLITGFIVWLNQRRRA